MNMADLQRMAAHHNSLPGAHITIYPSNSQRRQLVDIYRDGECLLQSLAMDTAVHVVASLINAKTQDLRKEEEKSSERQIIHTPKKMDYQVLHEILSLAKTELQENSDMGYTTPDGQYHIFIYKDQEHNWDDGPAPYSFFVIEPNKVVNGAHEPMGDTFLTSALDLSELLVGCQWCLEQFEADRVATLTTQDRAMALYDENLRIHNEDNDAYYIAQNLQFLARCVEANEEIPLDQLYRLAERLHSDASYFGEPFLNEERLDAVRTLLENGMREEYDACLGDLTPEQTLEFLLTCDESSFAFAVEQTAARNQEKYAAGVPTREEEVSFEKALKSFQESLEKPSLDSQIAGAAQRASEPSQTQEKTNEMEK